MTRMPAGGSPGKYPWVVSESAPGGSELYEVAFLVPCFNERENIAGTIDSIARAAEKLKVACEILVVDDGSFDGTADLVQLLTIQRPELNIRLIRNERNRGLGYSYFAAAEVARSTFCMLVHGKNVMSPEVICDMLSHRCDADMVVTYIHNDRRRWSRRVLSALFTKLVCALSGRRLRYFNGSVVHLTRNVRRYRGIGVGAAYQAELLCRLLREGKSCVEIPVHYGLREAGRTKAFRLKNIVSVAGALGRIGWRRFVA